MTTADATPSSAELQRLHDIITTARRTAKCTSHAAIQTTQGRRLDFDPPSPPAPQQHNCVSPSNTDNSPVVAMTAPCTTNRRASRMVLLSDEEDSDEASQRGAVCAENDDSKGLFVVESPVVLQSDDDEGDDDEQFYSLSSDDDIVISRVVYNTPIQQVGSATTPAVVIPPQTTPSSHPIVHASSSSSEDAVYIAPPRSTARKAQRLAWTSDDDDEHDANTTIKQKRNMPPHHPSSTFGDNDSSTHDSNASHNERTIPAAVYNTVPRTVPPRASPPPASNTQQHVPRRVRTAGQSAAAFARTRQALAQQLYAEYNTCAFDGRLPSDLAVSWSKHLKTTAGVTHYSRMAMPTTSHTDFPCASGTNIFAQSTHEHASSSSPSATQHPHASTTHPNAQYTARIELSTKVVDNETKLRRTLVHEMCHAAAWLLDHTAKPPHGPVFRRWAARVMDRCPDLEVTTCHNYEIFYAFRWQCTNSWYVVCSAWGPGGFCCMSPQGMIPATSRCGKVYGRHSNSLDVNSKVCGVCNGRLVALGRFNQDGTPAAVRAPTPYSIFVKEHFSAAKARCPAGTPHKEVMRVLADKWKTKRKVNDTTSQHDLQERFSHQLSIRD